MIYSNVGNYEGRISSGAPEAYQEFSINMPDCIVLNFVAHFPRMLTEIPYQLSSLLSEYMTLKGLGRVLLVFPVL